MFERNFFLLFVIVFMVGCGGESSTPAVLSEIELFVRPSRSEILTAINEVRSKEIDCQNGLGYVGPSQPLSWNDALFEAAYEHSNDLAMTNTFSHDGSGTEYDIAGYNRGKASYFTERIDDHGYLEYDTVGENIAGGFAGLSEVINGWLQSPAHCENLMREDFDEVGTAIVLNPNSQYGIYWTQNFGHREHK